jgi:hypothetical protein
VEVPLGLLARAQPSATAVLNMDGGMCSCLSDWVNDANFFVAERRMAIAERAASQRSEHVVYVGSHPSFCWFANFVCSRHNARGVGSSLTNSVVSKFMPTSHSEPHHP